MTSSATHSDRMSDHESDLEEDLETQTIAENQSMQDQGQEDYQDGLSHANNETRVKITDYLKDFLSNKLQGRKLGCKSWPDVLRHLQRINTTHERIKKERNDLKRRLFEVEKQLNRCHASQHESSNAPSSDLWTMCMADLEQKQQDLIMKTELKLQQVIKSSEARMTALTKQALPETLNELQQAAEILQERTSKLQEATSSLIATGVSGNTNTVNHSTPVTLAAEALQGRAPVTYAGAAAKRPPPKSTLIVRAPDQKPIEVARKIGCPSQVKIQKIRPRGDLLEIRCNTEPQKNLLMQHFLQSKSEEDNWTVVEKSPRRIKFSILNVPEEVEETSIRDNLVESLNNNYGLAAEVDEIMVDEFKEQRNGKIKWTFSASRLKAQRLLQQGYIYHNYKKLRIVRNRLLQRCFKCQEFGHTQNHCDNNSCCGHCGAKHDTSECKEDDPACINCILSNRNEGTDYSTDHPASSSDCPVYILYRDTNKPTRKLRTVKG